MNIWDILILIAVAGMIAGAVLLLRRSRTKGNGCCGGGTCTGSCSCCLQHCSHKEKEEKKQ